MTASVAIITIIYFFIESVHGDYCTSCKTVAQGAEFALESGEDLSNFVTSQCRHHEILYSTYQQIDLCKEIAAKIVANKGIQNKLRQPGSHYIEVCTLDLKYCQ